MKADWTIEFLNQLGTDITIAQPDAPSALSVYLPPLQHKYLHNFN
ncbi:MAG: hypothetical protein Q8N96_10440 [Methylovulum sp.]|nr:hypothetical protein [Methylovulum sp.]